MSPQKRKNPSPQRAILVIRMSSIGDIVLTSSFFSDLSRLFPKESIVWLVKHGYSEIHSAHPSISETIAWDKKKETLSSLIDRLKTRRFGLVIDLHDIPRTRRICSGLRKAGSRIVRCGKNPLARILLVLFKIPPTGDARLSVFDRYSGLLKTMGLANPSRNNSIHIPPGAIQNAGRFLPRHFGGYTTISEEATSSTKRWDKFPQLIEALLKQKRKVLLIGKHESTRYALFEKTYPDSFLDLTGKTGIMESAALIKLGKALVCNDTGVMHIGDALGIPTVTIWGPTVRAFGFAPMSQKSRIVENPGLKCRPCSLHGTAFCPLGHFRCMRGTTVQTVLSML